GHPESLHLFEAVQRAIAKAGTCTTKVSKSQIAFKRKRSFAAVWMPGQYLHRAAAPLVLTVFTPGRIQSRRWKQVVEPAPGRFSHHLEVYQSTDIDAEVEGWLQLAWDAAG
ncbi:MAG TPA: DUF5655 domain-containing protein, partial [Thermoanaerobaculia bacterium]|nr:DUF5655 domain-containing protein [Thermoanaerobaculia bacterium]